jgi:hypothetical protein
VDTANSAAVVICNNSVTVRTGLDNFQPVFADEQLIEGVGCEVEIVDEAAGWFMIGVATADLKNKVSSYDDMSSLCLYSCGMLYSDGK